MADNRQASRNPTQPAQRGVVGALTTRDFSAKVVKFEDQLGRLIPNSIKSSGILRADRVIGMLINLYSTNEDIRQCRLATILNSAAMAASVGLEFNNAFGHSAIIPYKNEATWQPMYRGLITLASRAGRVHDVTSHVVLQQDEFRYQRGTREDLIHIPADRFDTDFDLLRDWRYAYSKIRWKDAPEMPSFEVMDRYDIERIRRTSSRAQSDASPWNKHPEEMIRKTPIKRQMKTVDLTAHTALAAGWDDQAEDDQKQDMVLDWKDYKAAEDLDEPKKDYVPGTGEGQRAAASPPTAAPQPPSADEPPPTLWPEEEGPGAAPAAAPTPADYGPFSDDQFTSQEFDWMLQQAKKGKIAGVTNAATFRAWLGRYENSRQQLMDDLRKFG